jgi:hypothetical protein
MFRTFTFTAALCAALLGLLTAWSREARRERECGTGGDRAGGRVERCLTCHDKASEDPGGAHARAALGCASCHLGNPLAFGRERAHEGLEKEPGALATVALTCGRADCHAREASRVATSPMTRNAGIVAVDRFAFGETASPDGTATIADVLGARHPTPAQDHLRKLCGGCHLGTRRRNRDDLIHGNGSGCAACHVARRLDEKPRRHPPVDSRVTDDRCLGCHSGSGRIALSYQGLAEVEKGKPFAHAAPDLHQAAGMACIDCHLHTDFMGDGVGRTHEDEQVEITCEACHGPVRAGGEKKWREVKDEISQEILAREQRNEERREGEDFLRRGSEGGAPDAAIRLGAGLAPARDDSKKSSLRNFAPSPDAPARLGRRGTPLLNLFRDPSSSLSLSSSSWTLVRKLDGVARPVKQTPRDANHTLHGHERLSCSACHAAWVPTCNSCHTSFDPSGRQWDFAAGEETTGAWIEKDEGFAWAPPLLGVRGDGRIVPAAPGMILDVDASAAGGGRTSRRLLAPVEPHTTGKKARTCESCHRVPPQPEFEAGTRPGFRGLNAEERRRVADASLKEK